MTATSEHSTAHRNAGATSSSPQFAVNRLAFGGVLRSEWIKLSSLRSVRLTLALTVVLGLGMNAMFAYMLRSDFQSVPAEALSGYLLVASTFAFPFLALVFGVLGVFTMSNEYSSGMILSSLAAVPGRTPAFIAKAIVLAIVAAVTALVIVVGGLGLAVGAIPDAAGQLFHSAVVSGVLGTAAFLVLVALLAFGFAGILRSTAGGVAVVVGLTFVLPIAFQMLAHTGWAWVPAAADYLPTALGSTLSEGLVDPNAPLGTVADAGSDATTSTAPGYWQALGVMGLWAAAPVVPAAILFKTRDPR